MLNPNYTHVGPDAAVVGRDDFRRLIGRGRTAVKARLLNQGAISGVGNLLADEALWQARISPRRSSRPLDEDLDRLRREFRAAVRSAIRNGGAHTGRFVAAREREGGCPRDGHPLERATVGGRTTYWCPSVSCEPSGGARPRERDRRPRPQPVEERASVPLHGELDRSGELS